jgi:hypothetical protein
MMVFIGLGGAPGVWRAQYGSVGWLPGRYGLATNPTTCADQDSL